MQDDDLSHLTNVNPEMILVRFEDADGNIFFGALEGDARSFAKARTDKSCPTNKQSLEYYLYMQEFGWAMPRSPDDFNAPLTKRSPNGTILTAYLYKVNEQGLFLCESSEKERDELNKHASTYFMTAFLWQMHMEAQQRLLEGPKPAP